jgi:HTH-type transcriptional regulator/antitoxin HigA
MNIKPIKTKKDYKFALKEIDNLWDAKAGTPNGDKLDVLSTLIEAYELKNIPILPPDPIEAIKFRMEQQGMKNSDLAVFVGGRNRATEVLQRKRGLSLKMIKSLSKELHIPAESLLA